MFSLSDPTVAHDMDSLGRNDTIEVFMMPRYDTYTIYIQLIG